MRNASASFGRNILGSVSCKWKNFASEYMHVASKLAAPAGLLMWSARLSSARNATNHLAVAALLFIHGRVLSFDR